MEIPPQVRATLEAPSFWQFVTINGDGSPAATPVWVHVDGEHVLVNTAVGRRKERNVRRDPRVALATVDLDDPYAWIEIRGRVVEFVEGREAEASIDFLAKKYLHVDAFPAPAAPERRVILRIEPTSINYRNEGGSRIMSERER